MAAKQKTATGDDAPAMVGAEALALARRRMRFTLLLVFLLTLEAVWGTVAWWTGLPAGGEIRSDPFDPIPDIADLLLYPIPHRALHTMPYVPIGARGTLTQRPEHTDWINSPGFPVEVGGTGGAGGGSYPDETPAQSSVLWPEVIGEARAEDAEKVAPQPEIVPQAEADTRPQGQQSQQLPAPQVQIEAPAQQTEEQGVMPVIVEPPVPARPRLTPTEINIPVDRGGRPMISTVADSSPPVGGLLGRGGVPAVLDASCIDPQACFLVGESGRVVATADGGRTWLQRDPDHLDPTGYAFLAALPPVRDRPLTVIANDGTLVALATDPLTDWLIVPDQAGVSALDWGLAQQLNPPFGPATDVIWVRKSDQLVVRATEVDAHGIQGGVMIADASVGRNIGFSTMIGVDEAEDVLFYGVSGPEPHFVTLALSFGTSGRNINAILDGGAEGPVWVLGDGGLAFLVPPAQSGRDGDFIDMPTVANLRHIRFAAPETEGVWPSAGWITSGWYDGNDEGDRPVVLQTLDGGATWTRLSYRHWPAPWVFLAGFLAFVAGARGLGQVRHYRSLEAVFAEQERIIGADAASDAPIGWADEDVLGLRPIARALSRFIRNRDTIPPVTFGITGAWGTGKSSLMRLVADDLRYYGARPVMFNAWHHQTEDHLLAALLEAVKSEGVPHWWTFSGLLFRAKLLLARSVADLKTLAAIVFIAAMGIALSSLLRDGVVAQLLERLLAAAQGLLDGASSVEEFIGLLLGGLGLTGVSLALLVALFRSLRQLKVITVKPAALMGRLSARAGISQFEAQLGFRHRFQKEFGQVCKAMRTIGGPGMVIFIDDLDRCKPDKVLVILEAVNFLVSAGPCFIMLGIDEEKVIQSVAHGFKDSILVPPEEADRREDGELKPSGKQVFQFARNYLEKLINIAVSVPEIDEEKTGALLGADMDARVDAEAETAATAQDVHALPFTDLPRRMRMTLRSTQDLLLGVAPIAIAVALLVYTLADLLPPLEALAPESRDTAVTQQAPSEPGPEAADDPAAGETAADPAAVDFGEEPSAAADPAVLTGLSLWWLTGGLGLLALLIVIVALTRTTAQDRAEVQDRPEFLGALRLWLPLIHARHKTPRSIKRFQNHTRFMAMLLRGESRQEDWLDRLAARLGYTSRLPELPPPSLEERKLVAMQALYDFDPGLFEIKGHGDIENALHAFGIAALSSTAFVTDEQRKALKQVLDGVTRSDMGAFLELRPTVTSALSSASARDNSEETEIAENGAAPTGPSKAAE